MTSNAPIPPLTGAVVVALPIDQAFELFTDRLTTWWPHQFHIGAAEVDQVILEPRPGGRWYERGTDRTECDWGRVLAWEPPHRVLFTWQINGSFPFDSDPEHASEIEALFRAEGPDQTVVEVEHRHLERLVGGPEVRSTIEGGGGWALLLQSYATAATTMSGSTTEDPR